MIKAIRMIALHPLSPRWFKVLVLRLMFIYIRRQLKKSFASISKAVEKQNTVEF